MHLGRVCNWDQHICILYYLHFWNFDTLTPKISQLIGILYLCLVNILWRESRYSVVIDKLGLRNSHIYIY